MSGKDRTILLAVPLLAALAAIWLLAVSPKQDKVKGLDDQIAKLQGEAQGVQAQVTQGLRARRQFPRSYHRLVVAGKAVPAKDETASLLVQVNRAALASGVNFGGIGIGTGTSGSSTASTASTPTSGATGAAGLASNSYTLTFNGSFFEIANFISRIDRLVQPRGNRVASNGRLTLIDGFTLGPNDPKPLPALTASVDITTYSASGSAVAGGSAAAAAASTPSTSSAPATGSSTTADSSAGATSATTTSAPASP